MRNAVTRALEDMYRRVLAASWDYLDPEEMRLIKTQADEIKERAGIKRQ